MNHVYINQYIYSPRISHGIKSKLQKCPCDTAFFLSILKTLKNTRYNVCIPIKQKCKDIDRKEKHQLQYHGMSGREEICMEG